MINFKQILKLLSLYLYQGYLYLLFTIKFFLSNFVNTNKKKSNNIEIEQKNKSELKCENCCVLCKR